VDIPSTADLRAATVLIGTPPELVQLLTTVLSSVILDEVDMLLPNAPKGLRTALDSRTKDGKKPRSRRDDPKEKRRQQEQQRKLKAAQRKGLEMSSTQKQVVVPTDAILKLIAARYSVGSDMVPNTPNQVIAGSATASRRTLDRLNKALYDAAIEASSTVDKIWAGSAKSCRPEEEVKSIGNDNDSDSESPDNGSSIEEQKQETPAHTIRAVTVPQQVKHQFIALDKESASSPGAVLASVAKAAGILKPKMALVFLCGDFGKQLLTKAKVQPPVTKPGRTPPTNNKQGQAKRKMSLQNKKLAAAAASRAKNSPIGLSARQACSTLAKLGIDATPLHVAIGLELNAKDDDGKEVEENEGAFLVTFEGSARGLHIDDVDTVFVVGRPASAASYLHLAGRVGRASAAPDGGGGVVIRPGTVVSLCTKGSATELKKWTKQIGGTDLEELML